MLSPRWRPVLILGVSVVAIWVIALTGFTIAKNSRMTAEKVRAYMESVDLSKLSAADRAKALRRLADKINALSMEERRRAQLERIAGRWFEQMSEEEKGQFLEATMPEGFKQMLKAFEELPEDKRSRAVADALRQFRESAKRIRAEDGNADVSTTPPLSPELQAKVRTMGLQAFYSQSSAQTKAELAPLLEELQRVMESGRPFRGR